MYPWKSLSQFKKLNLQHMLKLNKCKHLMTREQKYVLKTILSTNCVEEKVSVTANRLSCPWIYIMLEGSFFQGKGDHAMIRVGMNQSQNSIWYSFIDVLNFMKTYVS